MKRKMAKGVRLWKERESPIVPKIGGGTISRVRIVMASAGPNRHSLILLRVFLFSCFLPCCYRSCSLRRFENSAAKGERQMAASSYA